MRQCLPKTLMRNAEICCGWQRSIIWNWAKRTIINLCGGSIATEARAWLEEQKDKQCEAKVKAFEEYVDKLSNAQKDKSKGPQQLKVFGELLKEAQAQENTVQDCAQGEFKTRVQNAVMLCKKIRTTK